MANKLIIPFSIIIAGGLIALAIFLTLSDKPDEGLTIEELGYSAEEMESLIDSIGVHNRVLGSEDPDVKIVEYSDLECPACKPFHPILAAIVEEYNGKVAWEFKHFPLPSLHRKATYEAHALECIGQLGGDKAFFIGLDAIYSLTPSNDGLNLNFLPAIAVGAGVDKDEFNACVEEERYMDIVDAHAKEAVAVGAQGTPHSVVYLKNPLSAQQREALEMYDTEVYADRELFPVSEDGKQITLSGMYPYEIMKGALEIVMMP